jgi:hypothetical protein
MKLRYGNLIVSGLTVILFSMACTPQATPPPEDMVNTLAVQMASILLTQTAAASSPTPLPDTALSTASPTDTPTPTVGLQPSETQSLIISPTFTVPIVITPPMRKPPRTKIPVGTPIATTEPPPSATPSETPSPTPTPTQVCESETASALLSVSAQSLKVGDAVKVTVRVNNEGCVALGLPQYRLYIQSDVPLSIFSPEQPDPVVHYLALQPGQSDSTEFDLLAVASGQATLTGSVSYEVHLGYPGPAYWGYRETAPLFIAVEP